MYGAQSAAREKNCQDTNLAVPFGPASVPWFDEWAPAAFNYTILVFVLFAIVGIWWLAGAKNRYKGPVAPTPTFGERSR